MRYYGARVRKSSRTVGIYVIAAMFTCVVATMTPPLLAAAQSGGSQVYVTICTDSSQIILTSPTSDSVVTQPIVPLAGTVSQASQIEVTVDGQFDGTIQLAAGQTNFTGQVELSVGTHTIGLKAVNICLGTDMTTSAVITYEAPLTAPSSGGNTSTVVAGQTVVPAGSEVTTTQPIASPGSIVMPEAINNALKWLNIDTHSSSAPAQPSSTPLQKITVGKAAVLGVGTALLAFGAPSAAMGSLAATPQFKALFGGVTFIKSQKSRKFIRRGGRLLGLILVILVILL